MKRTYKIIAIVVVVVIAGYFVLQSAVKHKLKSELGGQKEKYNISYANLSLNLLKGSILLDSVSGKIDNNEFEIKNIEIENFSYLAYVLQDSIKVDKIKLESPNIIIHDEDKSENDSSGDSDNDLKKGIKIKQVEISKANLSLKQKEKIQFEIKNYDFDIKNIEVSDKTLAKKIPFSYGNYILKGGELTFPLNKLQTLKLDSVVIETDKAKFHHIRLIPNYTKENYIEVLSHEDDLMDIDLEVLEILQYDFDIEKESFRTSRINLKDITANIYRDKTIADDTTKKAMYSKMIRDLDFTFSIDTLDIKNADLTYEEVQEKTGETGKVFFKGLDALATSITNENMDDEEFPTTEVAISTTFMATSPLQVNWSFRINDPQDHFRIQGHSTKIPPKAMNSFFVPAFNMKAKGEGIKELTFDFRGDQEKAHGKFKMVYDDLEIGKVDKDESFIDKAIGEIANFFMRNERQQNDGEVKIDGVKRDNERSFWNYLWKCVSAGLKKSVI